ncbi:GNAT family N-acetyltransferase [Microbacterium rhizomatis]|uniref:GNAT family N-acetyltransferase n=1 Tax=Microbacterium rhizomatis TaxID=1631477 RepID=A0A5J5IZG0_9MICO|nr:GNAT family N-acetyltransferase [Microbacterium rhizomatis]KAA9107635.1 GNAT family N-acetyltransferase [Microbacterium rhizomatis]
MLTVRPATIDDARAIAAVRISSWRVAYAGLIEQDVLDAMDIERESTRRAELWTEYHADPRGVDLIAESDGVAVGWASYGPSREAADEGELYALYAVPDRWATGVGHALMTEVERALRLSFTIAHLWVLDGNERAASFYERHGWTEDGRSKTEVRDAAPGRPAYALRERRRVRDLTVG